MVLAAEVGFEGEAAAPGGAIEAPGGLFFGGRGVREMESGGGGEGEVGWGDCCFWM